ncbi:MAG: fibronectin type III domain-containing protein [Desulfobacterales bacterium]|jgi:hypothetical protein
MKNKIKMIAFAIIALFIVCWGGPLSAATLVWDPNTDTVDGYKIYYGENPSSLSNSVNAGMVTQYNLDTLRLSENIEYFFCVSAYNSAGESDPSTAVSYTPADQTPPTPPGGFLVELQ